MSSFNIRAHWDADAQVWWAESDDVPGLVAEAATHDDLIADLRQVVPELLSLNMPNYTGAITLSINSDQVEQVSYAQMGSTFTRDVLKILADNGCNYVRTGRQPIYYSPISNRNFPVPNGIKSAHTANEALKQAGLQKAF